MLSTTPEQKNHLISAIKAFEEVKRYKGMMPRHVAFTFRKETLDEAESLELIFWDVTLNDNDCELHGVRLTTKGRNFLESDTPISANRLGS